MHERFQQPNTGAGSEGLNPHFLGVINSLSLPEDKKGKIIERVKRLEQLHWSNRAIENELELRFHIKIGDKKNPIS